MATLAVGSSVSLTLQGAEVITVTTSFGTLFRATFTPLTNQVPITGGGRTFGPQAQSLTFGPYGIPGTLVLENQTATSGSVLTYTLGGFSQPYVLSQSGIPVMIPQTSYINGQGLMAPGVPNAASVSLSGTSGSVTVTMGAAVLAGTSADVGKQITFLDSGGGAYRSALITAAGTTTTCTATLSSTASGTGPFATTTFIGYALPTNYTSGVWVYLPAGAITGGAAGFYFCTPATTTAFTTATVNGFLQVTTAFQASMTTPTIPTGYSNAVGGSSNYSAPTATNITLASVTVPGGAMGANGGLRMSSLITVSLSANNKALFHNFASNIWGLNNSVASPYVFVNAQSLLYNRNSQSRQIVPNVSLGPGGTSNLPNYPTVDTSVNQLVSAIGNLTNAADYIVLEGYTLEVLPAF